MRGWTVAGDRIDQGGFTTATLPNHHNKLAWFEYKGYILKNIQFLVYPLLEPHHLDKHALPGLVLLDEFVFIDEKAVWTNLDGIAWMNPGVTLHTFTIYKHA